MAGILVPMVGDVTTNAGSTATRQTMGAMRDAIRGTTGHPGFLSDTGALPASINDLFSLSSALVSNPTLTAYNPQTKKGWRGPYLSTNVGAVVVNADGTTSVMDAWNHAIVLQTDPSDSTKMRLVSSGQDGIFNTLPANATAQGDDIIVSLMRDGATW